MHKNAPVLCCPPNEQEFRSSLYYIWKSGFCRIAPMLAFLSNRNRIWKAYALSLTFSVFKRCIPSSANTKHLLLSLVVISQEIRSELCRHQIIYNQSATVSLVLVLSFSFVYFLFCYFPITEQTIRPTLSAGLNLFFFFFFISPTRANKRRQEIWSEAGRVIPPPSPCHGF